MADTADGPDLHPVTKELASGPNFAAVTTVFPSGMLQTHMIWAHVLDGQLVLNTEVHRAKYRNIQRDDEVTGIQGGEVRHRAALHPPPVPEGADGCFAWPM
jgi:hypothetical protein